MDLIPALTVSSSLIGVLFKGLREDEDGTRVVNRFGLYVPTRAGLTLGVIAVVITVLSIRQSRQAEELQGALRTTVMKTQTDLEQARKELREAGAKVESMEREIKEAHLVERLEVSRRSLGGSTRRERQLQAA